MALKVWVIATMYLQKMQKAATYKAMPDISLHSPAYNILHS